LQTGDAFEVADTGDDKKATAACEESGDESDEAAADATAFAVRCNSGLRVDFKRKYLLFLKRNAVM
jgi:hypothetical protein